MNPPGRDISHIKITAAVAVLVLVGVGAWEDAQPFMPKAAGAPAASVAAASTTPPGAAAQVATSSNVAQVDPIQEVSNNAVGELVGTYADLSQAGEYSSTTGAVVADSIGSSLSAPVSYTPLELSAIKTSTSTSEEAMLAYRAALQISLKPLLQNTTPEYELFGAYVETKQQTYLDQLEKAAGNYRAAASSTAALTVPEDAAPVQLELVNSMNEFAAVLDALAAHANDPIASSVLLENYNQAESDVLSAFQALVAYEKSKTN